MPISPSTDTPLPLRLSEACLHHIALVGMPGVGKSTVAEKLGEALGLPVLDLDEEIASAARQSITQLFLERGEVLFRAQERAVLRELLHQGGPSVIACGGGTWADATMRRELGQLSVPICLSAPVEVLLERLSDPSARRARPLLGGPDPSAALRKLERERRSAYLQCPDQIDTQDRSAAEVAQAVLDLLERPAPPRGSSLDQQALHSASDVGFAQPHESERPLAESVIEREVDRREDAINTEVQTKLAATAEAEAHAGAEDEGAQRTKDASSPEFDKTSAEPTATATATGETGLPAAPQIPWWPTHADAAADDSDTAALDAADAGGFDSEQGAPTAPTTPPSVQAATGGAPIPLLEENTPTLAEVARSLEPFAQHEAPLSTASHSATPSHNEAPSLEESWQPQMSAWAPLEDGSDGEARATEAPSQASATVDAIESVQAPSQSEQGPLMVRAQGRIYPVHIATSAGEQLVDVIAEHTQHGKLAIVCDTQINALFVEPLRAQLVARGLTVSVHTFVAGEEAKTLKTAYGLYDELSDAAVGRGDLVVGFGGGVTLDVAGFVASTYLRGVGLLMVPTSTLAAVDACVGGKNGVNTRRGKNLVGTIYPPHAVYIAMEFLATQSRRAHTAGLVEVLKMGALLDPELFREVSSGALLKLNQPAAQSALKDVLRRALWLKAEVVEQDEHERGRRAILNYGHTVGHALEIEGGNGLSHGEAVGLGMLAEAAWAEAQGLGDGVEAQLREALEAMNMPVDWRRAKLSVEALGHDKKRRGLNVQLPVLRALGDVTLHDIPLAHLAHYTQPPAPEA